MFGINPSPSDGDATLIVNSLITELTNLTHFLQTHQLAALSQSDDDAYTALQSQLTQVVAQFEELNPSTYGIVANAGIWNLLGADTIPLYLQSLLNATDQLLTANGYVANAVMSGAVQISPASARIYSRSQRLRPALLGFTLEDLTLATQVQLQLIQRIYGQYFQYLEKAVAILTANGALRLFAGSSTLDGITTGASLSFDIFHASNSVIEGAAVNLIPQRNDIYLIGPNQEQAIQDLLSGYKVPKNQDDLFNLFQAIVEKLKTVGESYQQAHQLPDDTSDFCILGNSPPCNQAIYSNGFNSVYASGGLPIPAPVLILVHNTDTYSWGSGVFNWFRLF